MERLSGQTLAEELAARSGAPDRGWALLRAELLLAALAAVHAAGVVHRDLKPANAFVRAGVDGAESVVLLDFGLAEVASPGGAAAAGSSGSVAGTPLYMAPEQIRGDAPVDTRADIYAFGVILFQLLTGRTPFVGHASALEHGHLALRPPRPSAFAAVSPALEALVMACLAKEPQRRPDDALTLQYMLEQIRVAAPPVSQGSDDRAKVLGGGPQTVVLTLVDTRAAMPAVIAAFTQRRGVVARQRGSRYVAAFSARETDQPAAAAHAAAQEIVADLGGRAALRLSTVTIRRREHGPPIIAGPDVEHPETWAPAEPWAGIVVDPEVKRLAVSEVPGASDEDVDTTVDLVESPLVGRGDVIATIEEQLAAALHGGTPALLTLFGDTSLGKSRLVAEAAAIARRVREDARVVVLRPGAQRPGEGAGDAVELLRAALNAPGAAPTDVLAFCRERLGDAVGTETASAVATGLGWRDLPHDHRFEQSIVRAITEGLRRRGREGALVILLDDAHRADAVVLDALESATLDGEGIALGVVAAAHPRFHQLRPGWGTRTQRYLAATLGPLAPGPAAELAAALLRPAEYPPADALSLLAAWSGYNPGCLTEVVRVLKRAGAIQPRPHGDGFYVATAELERLPASTAWQWLATRKLDALPPDAASFARLCAVLGAQFTRTELEFVQDAIDRGGQAGTLVEAGFGLDTLVERDVLRRVDADRYAFESRVIRDAIVDMVEPSQRAAIHEHALAYWKLRTQRVGATPSSLEPLAEHAAACGAWEEAADARLVLGDQALARHRHVEADRHYTAVVSLEAGAARRVRALLGRGRCRYRLHRPREAVDDLAAARALAGDTDHARRIEILLEEATALDWAEDFTLSAQRVEEAAALMARTPSPPLRARLLVGQARTLMREGHMPGAVDLLQRALANKYTARDHDTHIVALILLPVALVFAGRLDDAEARFQDALDLATLTQDWPHLSVTHSNRALLWGARKDLPRALDDMKRAVALAREIGNPFLERQATVNVAEILHWEGRRSEALALARRAEVLERRFVESHVADSSLLMARILLAEDEVRSAAELVGAMADATSGFTPTQRTFFRMLVNVLRDLDGEAPPGQPVPSWDDLLAEARSVLLDTERLELLYWRSRMADRAGQIAARDAAVAEARHLARDLGSAPQLGPWPGLVAP